MEKETRQENKIWPKSRVSWKRTYLMAAIHHCAFQPGEGNERGKDEEDITLSSFTTFARPLKWMMVVHLCLKHLIPAKDMLCYSGDCNLRFSERKHMRCCLCMWPNFGYLFLMQCLVEEQMEFRSCFSCTHTTYYNHSLIQSPFFKYLTYFAQRLESILVLNFAYCSQEIFILK